MLAILAARRLGMHDDQIRAALAHVRPAPMRFTEECVSGIRITNDAYNANPESMRAAIDTFIECQAHCRADQPDECPGRTILVLGEMRELGDQSEECHDEIALHIEHYLQRGTVDHAVFVGSLWRSALARVFKACHADRCTFHASADDVTKHTIADFLREGDRVFLKGSRTNALETVIHRLAERGASAVSTKA
jgi:UDP-N-acetylmuramoyl-tripeptide--D-alanyl-D-alanine ligase